MKNFSNGCLKASRSYNEMKQLLKKCIALCLTGILCIQITGCGQNGEKEEGGGQEAYIAEDVSLSGFSNISGECVYENTLYYAAVALEQATQTVGVYALDMGAGSAEPQRLFNMGEEEYIQKMTVDTKGAIYFISSRDFPDEENSDKFRSVVTLTKMDKEGNVLSAQDITQYFEGQEYAAVGSLETDQTGNIYFSDYNNEIYVLDEKGNLSFQANAGGFVSQICRSRSGKVFAAYWGAAGMEMKEIDIKEKGFGKKHEIPQTGMIKLAMGADSDLLIGTDATVYDYDPQTQELSAKFDWMNCDLITDYSGVMLSLPDGRIILLNKDYAVSPMKAELSVVRKAAPGEIAALEKTVLTYGGVSLFIEAGIRVAIKEFNVTNQDYRIEIKEYGADNMEEGIAQLNADIINGNGPDILALPVRFSMDMYAEKGVLEDLYPYIDNDETLDRSDFIPNIIKAFETEGKLYGIPIVFDIGTVMGKTSVIGERSSWNLDEMIVFADSCPEGTLIFEDASKSGVMRICRYANWDQLVDWSSEKNPFNRELYIRMLEFSNRFIDDEKYVYDNNLQKRIMDDQVLLMDSNVSDASAVGFFQALFGEPVTFIGFPSETGCGSVARSSVTTAINARSLYKEAAWEFISSILSEEFHAKTNANGFSIRKDGLERQIKEAMAAIYYTDKDGNQQEQAKGTAGIGGGFAINTYAAKAEEIEMLRKLIDSVDSIRTHEQQIDDIMAEEAQMYFSGSKTAEEVADIVENRIQVYVNETK